MHCRRIVLLWRRRMTRQHVPPFFEEFFAIGYLIALYTAAEVGAGSGSFEMDNDTVGLVVDAISPRAQAEAIVGVFIVGRLETCIERAEFQEQLARRRKQRTGTVIHFAQIAVQGSIRCFVVFSEIASGCVAENDTARFLQRS